MPICKKYIFFFVFFIWFLALARCHYPALIVATNLSIHPQIIHKLWSLIILAINPSTHYLVLANNYTPRCCVFCLRLLLVLISNKLAFKRFLIKIKITITKSWCQNRIVIRMPIYSNMTMKNAPWFSFWNLHTWFVIFLGKSPYVCGKSILFVLGHFFFRRLFLFKCNIRFST